MHGRGLQFIEPVEVVAGINLPMLIKLATIRDEKPLEELAPFDASPERYHHNRTGEDNADAHHKRQIMGREVVVAITDGRLHLGPWEHIFYYEFDGRRRKRILVKIIGE